MLFHHARELEHVHYGAVRQVRLSEVLGPEPTECLRRGECPLDRWHEEAIWFEPAYDWLAERIGFHPLFLSVGDCEDAWRMTGYDAQFHRTRKAEWVRNKVMFSFADLPEPLSFQDYAAWHVALGGVHLGSGRTHHREVSVSPYWERAILKRSYRRSDWLRMARRDPGSVQAAVPELDLRSAERTWCRNKRTARELERMGFAPERIQVRRMRVWPYW